MVKVVIVVRVESGKVVRVVNADVVAKVVKVVSVDIVVKVVKVVNSG